MSEAPDKKEGIPLPIWVGLGLTVILISGATWSGFGTICEKDGSCLSRWQVIGNAPSNEIGDTLSGVGSALAFIWLVITAWMQSQELREQRKELRQQRKEWEKISAAQDAQVRILEKQGEIFAEEQLQRRQQVADQELEALYLRCIELMERAGGWNSMTNVLRPEMPPDIMLFDRVERNGATDRAYFLSLGSGLIANR